MSKIKMTIDEQVQYLMQGAEYGDDQVKAAMAGELKERLLEAEKQGRMSSTTARLRQAPPNVTPALKRWGRWLPFWPPNVPVISQVAPFR